MGLTALVFGVINRPSREMGLTAEVFGVINGPSRGWGLQPKYFESSIDDLGRCGSWHKYNNIRNKVSKKVTR